MPKVTVAAILKNNQESDGQLLELQLYLSFLNNVMKIVHDVLLLKGEDGTFCELYDIMLPLKANGPTMTDGFLPWYEDQCYPSIVFRPKDSSNQT